MNNNFQIYYNPNCSKCRAALEILEKQEVPVEVVRYLDQPLKRSELELIVDRLTDPVPDLIRKDRRFFQLGLIAEEYVTREQVIDLILRHPELMQRPLILNDDVVSIARSSDRIDEILAR